jgi:hypothetical protein
VAKVTLRPAKTVQRVLISSTAHLVGDYDAGDFLLTHAWPDSSELTARLFPGPASRNAFIFSYTTQVDSRSSSIEELICPVLSVLFGKRFDSHGFMQDSGHFRVPDLSQYSQFCDHHLPQNSQVPRADFPVPLNLEEVGRIRSLVVEGDALPRATRVLQGGAKFYCQALQNAEHDPEVAYLHLVTAGEILSEGCEFDGDQFLDGKTRNVLARIREQMPDGAEVAKFVASRLLQIRRRFVETIVHLVDADFFARTEAREPFAGLQAQSFAASIAAAYDLRSQYVHTGIPFGRWISPRSNAMKSELQMGLPMVKPKDYQRILKRAPTFIGLERVIRYALLRFAQSSGAYIDSVDPAETARAAEPG